ncbi:MAG: ferritin family protein [Chloroflexi bacterium]|jgi:rubrerythrin|nr:ferritin family protein [Chloroflexota bacterium]MBT7081870.1 ferritin family protein [Chloroflexota bacterium]MBT7290738.1 ferritin family protein [Chloroflexota bacterium]
MNDYEFTETLKVLETAIQMEIDGKKFYLAASDESTNDLGKKLLASLAKEEDYHRQKFEDIFSDIQAKKSWPKSDFVADGGRSLRAIFSNALKDTAATTGTTSEIDAVKTAIDMEAKTLDYYRENGARAKFTGEKEFYEALAGQEREHQLILIDYHEYLTNPAAWYTGKEHHSMDAG